MTLSGLVFLVFRLALLGQFLPYFLCGRRSFCRGLPRNEAQPQVSLLFLFHLICFNDLTLSKGITMPAADKVRNNDPSLTELVLVNPVDQYSIRCVADWVTTFPSNDHVTTVQFDQEFLKSLSFEDGQILVSHLGQFRNLHTVNLCNGVMTAKALTKMVQDAQSLKRLELNHVVLSGSKAGEGGHGDFDDFHYSLFKHPTMSDFIWTDFDIRCESENNSDIAPEDHQQDMIRCMDAIIKALSSIPNLAVLKLQPHIETEIIFSGTALSTLCNSTSLQVLSLEHCILEKLHFIAIASIMFRTPLKKLSLAHTKMYDRAVWKMAVSMSMDSCVLEHMDLSYNDITDEGCEFLADGLLKNKTLKVLRLDGCKSIGPAGLAKLAAALQANTTLEQLVTPLSGGSGIGEQDRRVITDDKATPTRALAA